MLRAAGPNDLPRIAALTERHPMQLQQLRLDDLARLAGDPENRVMVWDRDGFSGYSILEKAYPQVYWLLNLALETPAQGEGRALIDATTDIAFHELGAHRLFLDTGFDNARALAAFERAGFVREGVMREAWLRQDGIWADCIVMAMLRREWQARRAG